MVVVMVMVALAQWQRLYIVDGGVMVEAEAGAMREYDSGISDCAGSHSGGSDGSSSLVVEVEIAVAVTV